MNTQRTFCACVVALVCASFAHANNDIWKTAASGSWFTGTNWVDNSTPIASDQATFDKAGTYTVTFNANPTAIQDLFVGPGNLTLMSSGASRTLNINSTSPGGGQDVVVNSAGTLTLTDSSDRSMIALHAGDTLFVQSGGTLDVEGSSVFTATNLIDNFGGTITVNGAVITGGNTFPATLNASASATVGGVAGTSTLTYSVQATGTLAPAGTVTVGSGASGTLNVNNQAGVEVGSLNVGTGSTGTGTINVDAVGTLTQSGADTTIVGSASGGSGTINVGTVLGFGTFSTGTGLMTVNATGSVNVGSGSTCNAYGNILINGGTINVNDTGSSLTQSGALTISVGAAGGSGTINVGTTASGGTFTTGTGLTTISSNGVVNVGSASTSGTFNAEGDLALAGTINIRGGSAVNLQTLTDSGGTISLTSGSLNYIGDLTVGSGGIFGNGDVTLGNNQQVTLTGTTTVDPAHTLTVAGGPVFSTGVLQVNNTGIVNIGSGAISGTLHSNSVGINGGQLVVGSNGSVVGGPLSITGGGLASFAGASGLLGTTVSGSGSLLKLQSTSDALNSGATWNLTSGGGLSLGGDFQLNSGMISVDGAGSTSVVASGKTLRIGDVVGTTTGVMNVTNDGSLTVGAGGTTLLTNHGILNINGGTVDLKTLNNSGTINFTAGSLSYLGNLTVGTGGSLGTNLILNADRQLTLSGATTVDASRTLTLSGGTLTTGNLVVNGAFNFIAGTLAITQAGASINTPIVTGASSTININANNVSLGLASSFTGFNYGGVLNVGANTVTLNSATYAQLGVLTTLAGGTISAPNGVYLSGGGNLVGNGAVNARITGDTGSVIQAMGALAFGDATSPAGFSYAGELRTKQFTVTLNSSGAVGLGNLTTLGSGASPGALTATNGYVVDFDEAVTGYGTINSSNTLAKRATINGIVQGTSPAQPITLSGYIKGTGSFTNVVFTGTHDPGLSPTLLSVGNIAYASTALLNIELGGTTRGSQYDAIVASGNLSLSGVLQLSLINGFIPVAGNSFDILDWATLTGTFSSLSLPTLSAGLSWNTAQLYTLGVLGVVSVGVSGDYNGNGIVDAADYTVWRDHLGQSVTLPNDTTPGSVTQADYDVWKSNFGNHSGSGSGASAAVPEPASLLLLFSGTLAICSRRWQMGRKLINS